MPPKPRGCKRTYTRERTTGWRVREPRPNLRTRALEDRLSPLAEPDKSAPRTGRILSGKTRENRLETRGPERGLLRPAYRGPLGRVLRGWLQGGPPSLPPSLVQQRCCSRGCSAEGPARTPGLRPPQGPNRVGNQTWPGPAVFLGIYLYPQEHFSNTFALSIATVP